MPPIGRIWIPTWTKIESACSRHLTNSSTSSCHNSSKIFLRSHAIRSFWPDLSVVKNHLKNSGIRIRIFTKTESIRPCHTPNLDTNLLRNPSTTFGEIVWYIVFWPHFSMVKNHFKNYQIVPGFGSSQKNRINSSLSFRDTMRFIVLGPISQWWRIT